MPTENRSSTEMVSDSEMTECQFHNNCGGWCETRRELEHNLCEHCLEAHDEEMAEPVQQRQGEPVAWLYSRPEGQVEPVVTLNKASASDRGSWEETPLYTHPAPADPGEVERLRGKIEQLRLALYGTQGRWAKLETELLAKLAERDALLAEIAKRHWSGVDFDLPADLAARIKAPIRRAEPSAPKCEPEKPSRCTSCDNCQGFNTGHDSTQQKPYSIRCDNCHKEARAADHSGLAKAWNAVNQAG